MNDAWSPDTGSSVGSCSPTQTNPFGSSPSPQAARAANDKAFARELLQGKLRTARTLDPERPDREQRLHAGVAPCHPWVLHGRHAVGPRWVPERAQRMWSVLTLEGVAEDERRTYSEAFAACGVWQYTQTSP